ncbi:P-loop containing nucleoside triphosphate hydrolase protein [Usnea florida]
MGKGPSLPDLLEEKNEPSIKSYNETVEDIIKDPQQLRSLTDDSVRDDILIVLTTHSHRLAQFFRLLRSTIRAKPKAPVSSTIAIETVNLLVNLLPHLHQLLGPTKTLEYLIPALDICLASSKCPTLVELASVLASSDTLLEHLVSCHPGIQVVRQWASMQNMIALDAKTLELWTDKLLSMVHNCAIDHDVAHEMQQWHTLKALKKSLQRIEESTLSKTNRPTPVSRHELPALASMTQLNSEDKKARLAWRKDTSSDVISLQDGEKRSLKVFDIPIPGSKSSLLEAIKRLEGEKTNAILLSISSNFPCYTCISGLESPSRTSRCRTHDEYIEAVPIWQMEILEKRLGLWKVLLTDQALTSLLHMGSHGLDGSVTDKLKDIASGRWNPASQPYAANKSQKKRLRVPIAKTYCGQNQFILWQISVGIDEETELPQQDITVWEVVEYTEIPKLLERVIFLQQIYSDETVRRCCQHSSAADGTQIPVRFENLVSHTAMLAKRSADLDIRTVDQKVIEMTNKFYTLTEPMIQSIISKDLLAEFPFDLSKDEARVIRHFKTASLILGRSGTGKTICLIFKLVGKYLASSAVADQRPVRQVLLTRSPTLAQKLNSRTRRLIKTLLPKSAERDSSEQSDFLLLETAKENSDKNTVFSLRDQSFPLVGTWDSFLDMLENTVTNLHRQAFGDVRESSEENLIDYASTRHLVRAQFVDFDAFRRAYWPHFSRLLTKGLPINLVFAEIMGVIKGSASSRESLEPLRQEEYLTRSCRLAPAFVLEAERLRVYEIFNAYEKLKLDMGGMDHVDRVVKLLRAVRGDAALKQLLQSTFDEVYIDEVQDHRCLDVELLLSFVRDARGFNFAGDTAQAISQDSTFRFSDIKALFFEHFAAASTATHQKEIARPEMFTLTENYRSHEGIPQTVDKLEPEIGHLSGPKPVLFRGIDVSILKSRNISDATLAAGAREFGAEQVILVRDAEMKKILQGQIENVGLILTILESKGMEFDDVILWNFFTECPDEAGIRSLELLNEEPERFDSKRHSGMCSELKQLYVAITRARVQLFIMESSETTATIVLKLLATSSSKSLVQVTSPSHDDFRTRLEVLRPGTSLSPQDWSRRGAELLGTALFKDAFGCFQKGQDQRGQTEAEGHIREEEGRNCKAHGNVEGFNHNLDLAKDCFLRVNLMDDAVRVLEDLGKIEEAAEILFQDKQYSRAARFFTRTGLSTKAIECHHLAEEYSEVAAMLSKERNYDRLVCYLDENRGSIPSTTLQCSATFEPCKSRAMHKEEVAVNVVGLSRRPGPIATA